MGGPNLRSQIPTHKGPSGNLEIPVPHGPPFLHQLHKCPCVPLAKWWQQPGQWFQAHPKLQKAGPMCHGLDAHWSLPTGKT